MVSYWQVNSWLRIAGIMLIKRLLGAVNYSTQTVAITKNNLYFYLIANHLLLLWALQYLKLCLQSLLKPVRFAVYNSLM